MLLLPSDWLFARTLNSAPAQGFPRPTLAVPAVRA
jgi:hypothetical protein